MSEQPVQPNPVGPPVTGAGYRCKVNADVWATIDRNTDTVFIWTRLTVYTPDDKPIFAPSGHSANHLASYQAIPLKKFKSEEHIGEFVRAVRARFEANGPLLISVQAALYLEGCVDLQDNETFPRPPEDVVDAPMLVAEHLAHTKYLLGLIYSVSPAAKKNGGRPRQWTKEELTFEIVRAFRELKPRERNYEGAAAKLKEWHGDRAPKSAGALFQQVRDLKMEWKGLKAASNTKKYRKG